MPKFIIEREVPGAGELGAEALRDAARESNAVIAELGAKDVQWQQSYITGDRIYCVYIARDEEIIREHARCLGMPATRIEAVRSLIDPSTADATAKA